MRRLTLTMGFAIAAAMLAMNCGDDAAVSCSKDNDCPTGQHCGGNGVCTFDCKTSADCVGGLCNTRGQCVPGGLSDRGPESAPDDGGVSETTSDGVADLQRDAPDDSGTDSTGDAMGDVIAEQLPDSPGDSSPDSGVDLGADSALDSGGDSGADSSPDSGVDSGADAPSDATTDATPVDAARDTCTPNGCGGCGTLSPPLNSPCGICGTVVCDGTNATKCDDKPPSGPFGAASLVASVNTSGNEGEPDITSDGLSLYFSRAGDVYVATRTSLTSSFGTPTIVKSGFTSPSISDDELTLYMVKGGRDIVIATRASKSASFGTPANVGGLNSQAYLNGSPEIASDGTTLYHDSNEAGGPGGHDIFSATRVGTTINFAGRTRISALSGATLDGGPTISADNLTIIFHRSVGSDEQLFIATRTSASAAWGTPVQLPGSANSAASEVAPSLSSDGKTVYFQSNRSGGLGGNDIWQTARACQ